MGIVNLVQTIPSLALFGFLLPLPFIGGVGKPAAIVALVLYALMPILRNTVVGILGVDAGVRESALAMGMTHRQILTDVELPLAFPTILAGIRIAAITTIGTATIAAATETSTIHRCSTDAEPISSSNARFIVGQGCEKRSRLV